MFENPPSIVTYDKILENIDKRQVDLKPKKNPFDRPISNLGESKVATITEEIIQPKHEPVKMEVLRTGYQEISSNELPVVGKNVRWLM